MPDGFYSSPFWAGYLEAQRSKLPVLPEIDDGLSSCVVRFLGCNPGSMQLQGTNTYLVGTGSTRILIDTGEGAPQWALGMTRYLEDHDISISHVLLTHWHKDHTGGIADLLAHDSNILVYKHRPDQGQLDIVNGQTFQTPGATLRAVLTPGHTVDHTCFVLKEENALFTGDNVLGHGYSVAEDLEAYTDSLRLMASLKCAIGYPGHGDVIYNLPQAMAKYIAQRVSRERQIYAVLARQTSSCSSSSNVSSASSVRTIKSGDAGGTVGPDNGRDEEDGNGTDTVQGLSTADIGGLIYGEVSKDSATFDSAVGPLLNQVLYMLLEQGKVGSRLIGPDNTRHWFATAQPI
ncbi:beta-lactamase-like protein [Aspergillus pseudotamarii]|uniref:Beta-lactamase-like protein n=1 Tax=Aspergillus pseudotamarii TaxID=132259 RepID=A0A5N6SVH7_ASPPS|nr:beta-lactamase-like protein [Aspergillus pseudotamarii]KAE8138688.1 beta-lactamase-like protein [Aspergillus pseudotamarii]